MLIRVTCPCGHVGIVAADRLPAELRCWQCGEVRHVALKDGRRIRSTDAFEEWMAGERERPQVRRKASA